MENNPLFGRINLALESIRPYLIADGGNVKIIEITDNQEVKIEFEGACVACEMSVMTFRAGIQDAIMKAVPEVKKVIAINIPALANS
jgi:Fe-S cluster biogenesis protein NfuA